MISTLYSIYLDVINYGESAKASLGEELIILIGHISAGVTEVPDSFRERFHLQFDKCKKLLEFKNELLLNK